MRESERASYEKPNHRHTEFRGILASARSLTKPPGTQDIEHFRNSRKANFCGDTLKERANVILVPAQFFVCCAARYGYKWVV